jgi:hypothetical protein
MRVCQVRRSSFDPGGPAVQQPALPPELLLRPQQPQPPQQAEQQPAEQQQQQQVGRALGASPAPPLTPPASLTVLPPELQLDSLQSAVQQHIVQRNSAPALVGSRAGSPAASLGAGGGGILSWAQQHPQQQQQQQQHISASAPASQRNSRSWAQEGGSGGGGAMGLGSIREGEQERLVRAVDCFREGVALIDVATPSWQVLYTNSAFQMASGGWEGARRASRGLCL